MPDDRKQLVWLVTGASAGLGLGLVKRILARGDIAVATARTPAKLEGLFGGSDVERLYILALDVTSSTEVISQVIDSAIRRYGRIDVLVNNAGILDPIGPGEEIGNDIMKRLLDTNFHGVVNCTNAILPHMRARKQGTVIIIGSRTVFRTEFPGLTAYGASKAAVHAYGETLASELKPMNVRVSIVVPGTFKTAFTFPQVIPPQFPEYQYFHDAIPDILHKRNNDPLAGDPEKGMDVIVDVVRGEGRAAGKNGWPLWLVLGDDGLADVKKRLQNLEQTMQVWGNVGAGFTIGVHAPPTPAVGVS